MECIITIEIGTNAVRILAIDLKGNVIAKSKGSYPTFHREPDYSEQDPDQMFITMLYVLKNLLSEQIHPKNHTVISICFSASMHSVLPVDRHGVPIGYAITWADNRGKNEALELKNSGIGQKIYEATGTPIHPMSPMIKIAWMKRYDSKRFEKTDKFITIKSYIIQQLTQDYLLDYSLASATGLLNIHTRKWENNALDFAGIKAKQLPDLVPVFHPLNRLRSEYQKSLGLPKGVKIIIGSSDGCLATLGGGIWEEEKATITIEDSGAVRVVGKKPLNDPQQRIFSYLLTGKYYVSGGPTNNGGIAFEWFTKHFGDFKEAYDIEYAMKGLITEASRIKPGSDGLLFLPYLLGERAPIWNANARGSYFGINIKHERQHFIRATLEGILYEIYSIGKTLEDHKNFNSLTTNGSFASIPFCTQILADLFNKPVSVGKNPDSIAQGAFLLSATDLGIFSDLEDAAKSVVMSTTFEPNYQNNTAYMKYFSIFERLSSKLHEEFADIARLQSEL
ncbi:gluconokinase [Algoriphagus yeomjeoni]|uniref:Gluconokinase n=1 Tax=Algoriphagus yeomjeoni TaxID=291403 RepID=A0A327PEP7_9BACT|nr:gluconokinase [Algoriphagus yeomjeoni]RAI89917.1 gluconokinase [Algoriphagus yeomjeoni]